MIVWSLAAAYIALLLIKCVLAIRASAQPTAVGPSADLSRLAIAQPILSGDPALEHTLDANVRALEGAHVIWLVDEDDPLGIDICERLIQRHPSARIDIVQVPIASPGVNPKLFKLERARAVAGDRIFVVLDDDARLPEGSAAQLMHALGASDLSTALPAYTDDGRWPSRLLAQFVNNNAALTYLPLLNVMPPITINGMAYAMSAETLTALGGFEPIQRALTDDLAVARRVIETGRRIHQTAAPVWVSTTVTDGRHYMRQMHRWYLFALLLVQRQPIGMQMLITLLNASPALLLWSCIVATAMTWAVVGVVPLAALVVIRAGGLMWLQQRIYGRHVHRPFTSLVSELLQPVHLLHALCRRTIVWRTRRYRVIDSDRFEVAE